MRRLYYCGHRFPPVLIQHAIRLYLRFTLSDRTVEDLLAERGFDVPYETIRRWVLKFGPAVAQRLRTSRPKRHSRWHLDEMVARIGRRRVGGWRAVDADGESLDFSSSRVAAARLQCG